MHLISKIAFITLSFIWICDAQANIKSLPEVQYEQSLETSEKSFSTFDSFFSRNNFLAIKLSGAPAPFYSIEWADRIFVHQSESGVIILKGGVKIPKQIEYNTIYSAGDGDYLVHFKAANELSDVLYFSDISAANVAQWIKKFESGSSASAARAFRRSALASLLLLPEARAESTPAACSGARQSHKDMKAVAVTFGEGAIGCVKGLLLGVYNSTAGIIVAGVKAVAHPVESFRAVRAEFRNMAYFASHFSQSLGQFKDQFAALPGNVKSKIVCEMIASIGTSIFAPALFMKALPHAFAAVAKVSSGTTQTHLHQLAVSASMVKAIPKVLKEIAVHEQRSRKYIADLEAIHNEQFGRVINEVRRDKDYSTYQGHAPRYSSAQERFDDSRNTLELLRKEEKYLEEILDTKHVALAAQSDIKDINARKRRRNLIGSACLTLKDVQTAIETHKPAGTKAKTSSAKQ